MNMSARPKWMIWCMETEDGFMMIGSRKVNQLDIEVKHDFLDSTRFLGYGETSYAPITRDFDIAGSVRGFTTVTGKTELECLVSLLSTFQQEEQCEKAEAETVANRAKEEKKRKKAHNKAKKSAMEGKFDAAKCPKSCYYCLCEGEYVQYEDYSWHDEAEEY